MKFTALIKQDGDWWTGWVAELPGVNGQERTRDELLASLKVALAEALEFARTAAVEAAGTDFAQVPITP